MSTRPIVRVSGLGKRFQLGELETFDSLRDAIPAATRRLLGLGRRGGLSRKEAKEFWALKDVSFDVQEGEVLGIIGRNGAGKSTLLKILSRITEPTEGEVRIRGRVSSLLEVGTGFHPDLTGRENVYLNGTILGMTKREIDRKFDEIVAFSGVEKFLDTPVKRYSSGMSVRLAFAVAAHLEPDILIIDEVLAVGDAEFQKKCLGKMQDVAGQGRTVLFVSHNMAAVQGLCTRAIVLRNGEVHFDGGATEAVRQYLWQRGAAGASINGGRINLKDRTNSYTPDQIFITGLALADGDGVPCDEYPTGRPFQIRVHVVGVEEVRGQVGVIFKSQTDEWLAMINTGMCPPRSIERSKEQIAILNIPRLPFVPGTYWIDVSVARKGQGRVDYVERAARLEVCENDVYSSGYTVRRGDGVVYIDGSWSIENASVSLGTIPPTRAI